ncbi:MAG TPA: hypothetical protein VH062_13500 [Polyangiaceae bacterium]|jgi:hypothetical protein|nr:hypothetical protein [Polyangiaceae bacterium]
MHSHETQRRLRQLAQNATELARLLEPAEGHGLNVASIDLHKAALQKDIVDVKAALGDE